MEDHMNTVVIPEHTEKTIAALNERGVQAELVQTGADALQRIQSLVPAGASLMTGGSLTLRQIGLDDLLIGGSHAWKNLKNEILAEKDLPRQLHLRKQSTLADYFLGSPQAITETGEMVFASAGGSQLAAYAYSSSHLVWVAGIQKIVPTLDAALQRVRDYCLPKEDERMKGLGMAGSFIGKLLIFEREHKLLGRNVHLILVNETLGV
jgi:hypothetical protein